MAETRTMFCALCRCEVEDWGKHVESEQHQENLADPVMTGTTRLKYEREMQAAMKNLDGSSYSKNI